MRRYALGLVAAGCMLAVAGCGGELPKADLPSGPAPPQRFALGWAENAPTTGEGLTFRVRSFSVTATGWSAEIGIDNRTAATWRLGSGLEGQAIAPGSRFGVMVLPTGDLADVDEANRAGTLPPVRAAHTIAPALPATLGPGGLWDGTITGEGRLPAGLWVRVSFGPLTTEDTPPEGIGKGIVWFTDHAFRLRG